MPSAPTRLAGEVAPESAVAVGQAPSLGTGMLIACVLGACLSGMIETFPQYAGAWFGWELLRPIAGAPIQVMVAVLLGLSLLYRRIGSYWLSVGALLVLIQVVLLLMWQSARGAPGGDMAAIMTSGILIDLVFARWALLFGVIAILLQRSPRHLALLVFSLLGASAIAAALSRTLLYWTWDGSFSLSDRALISPWLFFGFAGSCVLGIVIFLILLGSNLHRESGSVSPAEVSSDGKPRLGEYWGWAGALLIAPFFYLNRFDALFLILVWLQEMRWLALLWIVSIAGRERAGHGWATLLIPFAVLFAVMRRWAEAKRPFLLALGCAAGALAMGFFLLSSSGLKHPVFDMSPDEYDLDKGHVVGAILAGLVFVWLLANSRFRPGVAQFWGMVLLLMAGSLEFVWNDELHSIVRFSDEFGTGFFAIVVLHLCIGFGGFIGILWLFRSHGLTGRIVPLGLIAAGVLALALSGAAWMGLQQPLAFRLAAVVAAEALLALALATGATGQREWRPLVAGVALATAQFLTAHALVPLQRFAGEALLKQQMVETAGAERPGSGASAPVKPQGDHNPYSGRIFAQSSAFSLGEDPLQHATSEFYRHRGGNNSEPKLSPAEAWAKMSPESVQRLEGLIEVKKMQLWAVAALAMVTALAGALLLRSAHISRSIPNQA